MWPMSQPSERTQSMEWFGEPWPSSDRRAEICSDDAYHRDVPVGIPCFVCNVDFVQADQGVLIPMALDRDGWTASHLSCFIGMILGKKGHRR